MLARLFAIVFGLSIVCGCKPSPSASVAVLVPAPAVEGSLPKYWQVPAFELTDQEGQPFNSVKMLGKVWIVDFFYTTCPGPCPALTSRLSGLHKSFSNEGRLAFLSISSDPEKDTPEVLRQYASKFGADSRWTFLTGPVGSVFSLANQGFKLSLTRSEKPEEPVTHSTRLILVDAQGWVRSFFEGVGEDSEDAGRRLEDGVRKLLQE
ncbi:MAG: SCO family protein [Verrucomicrobiota bacterium]